jgi:hypothetical protein
LKQNEALHWSLELKQPPFPFNLESHIICCGIITCIIFGNLEAQYKWALYHGLWDFLGYIAFRAALTIALAFCSQLGFKYFIDELIVIRDYIAENIEKLVLTTVARLWSIQIDFDRDEDPADQLLGFDGETPRALWELLTEGCLLILNLVWMVVLVCLFRGLKKFLLSPLNSEFNHWLWELILGIKTAINELNLWVNYAPSMDDIWASTWRLGGQVTLQIVLATVLFLVIFLLRAKAVLALTAYQDVDHMERLQFWAVNLRGTAVHLVSYTAYQVISFIVAAYRLNDIHAAKWTTWRWSHIVGLRGNHLNFPGGQFQEYVLLSVVMGIMALVVHLALRAATRALIKLCSSTWTSFILWKTLWTASTVERIVDVYLRAMEGDFSLDDRVVYRALMTLLFGDLGPLPMTIPEGHNAEGLW